MNQRGPLSLGLEDLSWFEQLNFWRSMCMFPSITVIVFIRRKIGFRALRPGWLTVMMSIMLVLPLFSSTSMKPFFGPSMAVYAIAMFALGRFQRWLRWRELCRGEIWHSRSAGISYLEMLPLPAILRSHHRVNRYLDPVFVVLIGIGVSHLSMGTGAWIMFSGIFLFIYEQKVYEDQIEADLDTIDSMVMSEAQGALVKRFQSPQTNASETPSIELTCGIPTGLSPELAKQIELRKAKRRVDAQPSVNPI